VAAGVGVTAMVLLGLVGVAVHRRRQQRGAASQQDTSDVQPGGDCEQAAGATGAASAVT
jgi:MYXO-CTERM domain-containing protein